MKRNAIDHYKMVRLEKTLGIERWGAVGIMESIWHFTAKFTPAGDIGSKSNQDIADGIFWNNDPNILINALIKSGFIDENPIHRLIIHGWSEHAEDSTQVYLARNTEYFADGNLPKMNRLSKKEKETITKEYSERTEAHKSAQERTEAHKSAMPLPLPLPLKEKDFCVEASKKEAINAGVILEFPVIPKQKTGKPEIWNLTQPLLDEFIASYPAIDALTQCKAAHAWIIANPKNRKTFSGMPRFLNGWLSRAQNSAPRIETQTQPDSPEDKKRKLRDQYDAELSERIRKLNGGFDNPQAFIDSCELRLPIHRLPEKSLQSLPHWNQYHEILQANSIATMPIKPPEMPRFANVEDAKSLD